MRIVDARYLHRSHMETSNSPHVSVRQQNSYTVTSLVFAEGGVPTR